MNDLQKCELKILKFIVDLFDANQIEYCLAYGSVLGAVRHKGFIPWDDDVDIFVKAKDYPKIRELFLHNDTGKFQFHDYQTIKGYPYVFPKVVDTGTKLQENAYAHLDYVCGVYVDIFPVFEVSDHSLAFWVDNKKTYFQYGLVKFFYRRPSDIKIVSLIESFVKRFINVDKAQSRLYSRYTNPKIKGNRLKEPNVFSKTQLVKKCYFDEYIKVVFEDLLVPVFAEYDGYLTDSYGDYMTPPPIEQQKGAHDIAYLELHAGEVE